MPGFSPDPSICRVGEDFYLVNSSFVWFPGIPIYHSKDLIHWELIGHGLTRPSQINFKNIADKDGIWAVTIRYHNGLFYLVGTANNAGGNFIMTATNPAGQWSDPVWLQVAGIDASLFWDDDGKCYFSANDFGFKKSWPGQCQIWTQEFDPATNHFIGDRSVQTFGHANNAANTEGPHLYKVDGHYLLLAAEGGTDYYHAITAHHGDGPMAKFISDKTNPVLSHRQLGKNYPIQAVGHGDLVQTQNGEWWAVVLGKRKSGSGLMLTRETFLCKVLFEDGTPIFNPGYGKVLMEQQRPNLLWTPFKLKPVRDNFTASVLGLQWNFVRVPQKPFHHLEKGNLKIDLLPEVADSLVNSAMVIQRIDNFKFNASTLITFEASHNNEQAGLIIYRNSLNYFALLKMRNGIQLIKINNGKKEIVSTLPYSGRQAYLKVSVNDRQVSFSYGPSNAICKPIGGIQDLMVVGESKVNRFNGPGIGLYASSNGQVSNNSALYDWFEYRSNYQLIN